MEFRLKAHISIPTEIITASYVNPFKNVTGILVMVYTCKMPIKKLHSILN